MKIHLQRYLAEISTEIERAEKLETELAQSNARLETIDRDYDAMVQSFKKLKIYTDLEAERDALRSENKSCHSDVEYMKEQLCKVQQALDIEIGKKRPIHYWEVTVKLRDGRLGTYTILDWPRNIKADEVFRDDVTLSLHRVVS